jgi:hypothetical protein
MSETNQFCIGIESNVMRTTTGALTRTKFSLNRYVMKGKSPEQFIDVAQSAILPGDQSNYKR